MSGRYLCGLDASTDKCAGCLPVSLCLCVDWSHPSWERTSSDSTADRETLVVGVGDCEN